MNARIEAYALIAAAAAGVWAIATLINSVMGPLMTIFEKLKV